MATDDSDVKLAKRERGRRQWNDVDRTSTFESGQSLT
jgi:hypothetical protein